MTLHHFSAQTAAVLAFLITVALAVAAALVGAMPEWVAQSADSLPSLPAHWDTLLPLEASASH